MNKLKLLPFFGALAIACPAQADDRSWTVVPAIDVAFKNNSYSFPTQIDVRLKSSFTTLVPSLTLAYGRFYGSVNYDFTIADSEKYLTGTAADPEFTAVNYNRRDASATLGYRVFAGLNLFAGYTLGKGTLLLSGNDGAGAAYATTRVYNEKGFFAGASYSHSFSEKGALNASAAYGSLDGLLTASSEADSIEILSKAPGYSLNLAWIQAASKTLSYRIGVKYTSYTFNGKEYRENGVVTPMPRTSDYYERITTFYIGVVDYF